MFQFQFACDLVFFQFLLFIIYFLWYIGIVLFVLFYALEVVLLLHTLSYVLPPSSSKRTNFLSVRKEPFSPREVRDDLLWEDYTHISLCFSVSDAYIFRTHLLNLVWLVNPL